MLSFANEMTKTLQNISTVVNVTDVTVKQLNYAVHKIKHS